MKNLSMLFCLLLIPKCAMANKNERYYQTIHCNKLKGQIEYRLEDKTRIDCLTENEAIEHDWAQKWAECLGQALYYGAMEKKTPTCVLIGTKKEFDKFSSKIEFTSNYYNLPVKIFHIEK